MHWDNLLNSVGSLMIVATASTKTMVPLRILAIVANCVLIIFYAASHEWVPFALQFPDQAAERPERRMADDRGQLHP